MQICHIILHSVFLLFPSNLRPDHNFAYSDETTTLKGMVVWKAVSLYNLHLSAAKIHDDVIKWKHFPHYWPFVRGIHRSPVISPHNGH